MLIRRQQARRASARRNRGWSNQGREPDTPEVHEPVDIRSPHHAKRWKLGVGRTPGDSTTEGVFAMGKDTEEVVFKIVQMICTFRGHQQSTRPRQPLNQAWAHNGIREGTPGCLYINAYNNQDSPVRWLRMAGHEDLANCRIRCIPKQQGGGLGVYALDEIWHGQELLLANREYPMEGEATARENIPEVLEDGTEDEEVMGEDEAAGEVA